MHPYDGRVVSNFIMQAINGEDITIYGDGLQTRSFCFVDDLLDAMVGIMEQDDCIGPINIGNPVEYSVKELAETVVRITGSSSKIIYLPLPHDDPKRRKPDISLAKGILDGWEPSVTLEEGIKRTVEYFRALDLRYYKRPTMHTAHKNSEDDADRKSRSTSTERNRSSK